MNYDELKTMSATSKNILLTGGTGQIGRQLVPQLLQLGYSVNMFSRRPMNVPGAKVFLWDVDKGEIDAACIEGVDTIIHLAGEGIADKPWTEERKKAIVSSRTESIRLIYSLLKNKPHHVERIISASAIGYYSDRGDELMTEESTPNDDFMARCCMEWETAVDEGKALGLQVAKFRTGVVLSEEGALAKMATPVKWFVGAPLGDGKQWIPWIHIDDVTAMYLFAVQHSDFEGIYNQVSPNPVTNKQLTRAIARQLHRPIWPFGVPKGMLKLLLGEMSTIVLGSTRVSAQKIQQAGFKFKYMQVDEALKAIYG